jgi:Holliday junction DNA helicase RuvB
MDTSKPIELLSLPETVEEYRHDFHPKSFDEYLGQTELKQKLNLYAQAAKMRQESLDHTLLSGPPGLGKTTLAQIIAQVMGVGIKICSGPMLERTGDLVALLTSLDARDIFFIDEIHRMPANVEEVLYSAMEHFRVDIIIGQGAGAKSVNLPINPFTLVGATTKSGMLSAPLRSRFGINERLDFYSDEDLQQIVEQSARFLDLTLTPAAALMIAQAARGTPRIAKKILRRVRDFAQVSNHNKADEQLTSQALSFLGIAPSGLSSVDEAILRTIIDNFNGGPVGLETIASIIGEDSNTIEEVYEPFLMRKGFLERTPRGRQIPYKLLPLLKSKYQGQIVIFPE